MFRLKQLAADPPQVEGCNPHLGRKVLILATGVDVPRLATRSDQVWEHREAVEVQEAFQGGSRRGQAGVRTDQRGDLPIYGPRC